MFYNLVTVKMVLDRSQNDFVITLMPLDTIQHITFLAQNLLIDLVVLCHKLDNLYEDDESENNNEPITICVTDTPPVLQMNRMNNRDRTI